MDESAPELPSVETYEQRKQEYIELAKELAESNESFPFPGIEPTSYTTIKQEEDETPNYADFATLIDELLEKFKIEGMKVILSAKDPTRANILIVPTQSKFIEYDNLSPKHLVITEDMDERLKRLISIDKLPRR